MNMQSTLRAIAAGITQLRCDRLEIIAQVAEIRKVAATLPEEQQDQLLTIAAKIDCLTNPSREEI